MADAVEIATAYLSIVPSLEGAQGTIAKQLIPEAEKAGEDAGSKGGGRFHSTFMKVAAPAAIGAGVVAGFKGLYEVGDIFDEVADTIRVGTGASGDALDGLVDIAHEVGRTVPAEFSAIGPVVADVNTRLGLTGDTLETVASQYLEAGRMLGEEIDVGTTTAAFSAFRIEGDAVVGAMDTLFQVSQATGIGMNELASSVQRNAPAVQALGFSFEETAALVGSLDKAGLNSSQTMAAMQKGLSTLSKAGEEPQEAFRRTVDEIGKFIAAGDTAAAVNLAGKVFGTRGASQFVGAIESGTLALDDLVAGVGASGDTILAVGEETQDFAEKWQMVKNNALLALEPLGSAVFGALGEALSGMLPTLTAVGSWLGENTWAFGVIAGVIGGVLLFSIIMATAAMWPMIAAAWALTAAFLANPVTWIVVGIVALIAALVLLIANWDKVAAWVSTVWASVVEWLKSAWQSVAEWFTSVGSSIGSFLTNLWTSIKTTATNVWNSIVSWVSAIPGRIMAGLAALGQLAGKFLGWVGGAKDAAVGKFNELVGWVAGIPGRILGALGNLGGMLVGAGRAIITGFLDGLKRGFEAVKSFVGGIGSWIASHKGPRAYDLALLVPAGGWIMTGLRRGIEAELPNLRRTLHDVTSTIEVGASPRASLGIAGGAAAVGGGGRHLSIVVNNPTPEPAGQSITKALAKVAYLGLDGGD